MKYKYNSDRRITIENRANVFSRFKKYAFRLELLQDYDVEEEKDSLHHFLKTGEVKNHEDDWASVIQSAVKRGAVMQRVHVITKPLTDYMRFELKAYVFNIKKGEKVFLLSQEEYDAINTPVTHDFWLFDDTIVLQMQYTPEGKFLYSTRIRGPIKPFIELKNKLLTRAHPL